MNPQHIIAYFKEGLKRMQTFFLIFLIFKII